MWTRERSPNRYSYGAQWTSLHVAAREDRPGAVKVLIEFGADVNARDILDETPLHKTIAEFAPQTAPQTAAIVRALINAGANPKARDRGGRRPLDLPMANILKILDERTYRWIEAATAQ